MAWALRPPSPPRGIRQLPSLLSWPTANSFDHVIRPKTPVAACALLGGGGVAIPPSIALHFAVSASQRLSPAPPHGGTLADTRSCLCQEYHQLFDTSWDWSPRDKVEA